MNENKITTIGVLCSGGDSPGMNAAVRAVVRTAIGKGLTVYGIQKGYAGLLEGNIRKMDVSSVGNIIQHGGTILQTSRCLEFHKPEIRTEAVHILKRKNIDALVVIGGDGSFNGANLINKEHGFTVIGIPGTIDNDISGTEYTIGFDTAISTAVDAVDKIRDTAASHERTFFVEVMGRNSPAIAYHVGVCTGAENVIMPGKENEPVKIDQIAIDIKRGIERGKKSSILIVAEGHTPGLSYKISQELKTQHKIDSHVCVLGHIQRGGNPTPLDRFMASKMGYLAVMALLEGKTAEVTVYNQGRVHLTSLSNCLTKLTTYDVANIDLLKVLSI